MNTLDGLYYTYYWMYRNDGDGKWASQFYVLIFLEGIALPYLAVLWFIPSLIQDAPLNILGIEIPMYVLFILFFAFLCIRFGWRKRYAYIISEHALYGKGDYRRLRNIGIISFCIGGLIFFILCFIKLQDNIAASQ